MTEKMVFLNCPVCKCGIDVSDSGWSQICCPNCKIDIARQDWVERDVLEGMYLDHLEAAQQSVQRTGCTGDHDLMLSVGVETCTVCGQSTQPARR